jgi:hypothetical protein
MNLPQMIVHVLQFAETPLSAADIAARIGSEFGETVAPEHVDASLQSDLVPAGQVLAEDGRYALCHVAADAPGKEIAPNPEPCDLSLAWDLLVAQDAAQLDLAYRQQRAHLRDCVGCRNRHPELERRFHEYDISLLESFPALVDGFRYRPPDGLLRSVAVMAVFEDADPDDTDEFFNYPLVNTIEESLERLVAWRSLLLAAQIGRKLLVYTDTFTQPEGNWWNWREGRGDTVAAQFVPELTERQFYWINFAHRCALTIRLGEGIAPGLLRDLFDSLAAVQLPGDYRQFEAAYSQLISLSDAQFVDGQRLSQDIAASVISDLIDGPSQSSEERADVREVIDGFRELKDTVKSNSAAQIPLIDLLQRLVERLGEPSRQEAEDYLRGVLGGTFSLLCTEAQTTLIAAEQLSRYRELTDPSAVVVELRKAFELQLKAYFLKPLCSFLRQEKNRYNYPADVASSHRLMHGGRLNDGIMLGKIADLLERRGQPEVEEFAHKQHVNLRELVDTIEEVSAQGGEGAHRVGFAREGAHRLKEQWLRGAPFGTGIFSKLVTRRDA